MLRQIFSNTIFRFIQFVTLVEKIENKIIVNGSSNIGLQESNYRIHLLFHDVIRLSRELILRVKTEYCLLGFGRCSKSLSRFIQLNKFFFAKFIFPSPLAR